MQELATWLAENEQQAADFYRGAAAHFAGEPVLNRFLAELASDEREHCLTMQRAANIYGKSGQKPAIILDQETRSSIVRPLLDCRALLASGALTREAVLDSLVNIEFSEWNDIFLYVTESLVSGNRDCIGEVAAIEGHRRHIVLFLESQLGGQGLLEKIKNLRPAWCEKILVVDDFPPFAGLMKAVLGGEGEVETAENGEEALEKTKQHYYRIIVSDVDMPVMNGLDFYLQASSLYPGIGERFLFLTGDVGPERSDFFTQHRLGYFEKPASILEIREKVIAMMGRPAISLQDGCSGEKQVKSERLAVDGEDQRD